MPIDSPAIEISEISNPTCVGWDWHVDETLGEESVRYAHEIVWLRGTSTLLFGVKIDGRWLLTAIDRPERFGDCSTLKGARAAAHNFIFDREPGDGPREME